MTKCERIQINKSVDWFMTNQLNKNKYDRQHDCSIFMHFNLLPKITEI